MRNFGFNLTEKKEDVLSPLNLFDIKGDWEGEGFSAKIIRDEIIKEFIEELKKGHKERVEKELEENSNYVDKDKEKYENFKLEIDDPIYAAISSFVYREILLKQRINTTAAMFCRNLEKIRNELPESVGLKGYYEGIALENSKVKDAFAKGQGEGIVIVYVCIETTGELEEERAKVLEDTRAEIQCVLNKPNKKMLGDEITVRLAKKIRFSITPKLSLKPGTTIDMSKVISNLKNKFNKVNRIGKNFDKSWFIGNLFSKEVEKVEIEEIIPSVVEGELLSIEVINEKELD